jgi:hypothetical protein
MRTILGPVAEQLGWQTRFQQRKSKLNGSEFVQCIVFAGLANKDVSYTQLCESALDAGVVISPQGLEQRFSPASAELCRRVLDAAVKVVLTGYSSAIPVLMRFHGVYLRDSSVINLPIELFSVWPGVGGSAGKTAAVKLQVRLEYTSGQLAGPVLQAGREHDSHSPYQDEDLPAGAIRLGDLGFFSLHQFAADQRQGVYTLSRYKIGTGLYDPNGQPILLLDWLRGQSETQFEARVILGQIERIPCRLLVERVPQEVAEQRRRRLREYARKKQVVVSALTLALTEWTLIVTDIPSELLSIPEALVLLAVRWQIELLFKRWKSLFQIDQWRSQDPWRILTELYAKLIGVVILNWVLLLDGGPLSRRSLWKAALAVRHFAPALALALPDFVQLELVLTLIHSHLRFPCRLTTRYAHPGTAQNLLAFVPDPTRTLA